MGRTRYFPTRSASLLGPGPNAAVIIESGVLPREGEIPPKIKKG